MPRLTAVRVKTAEPGKHQEKQRRYLRVTLVRNRFWVEIVAPENHR